MHIEIRLKTLIPKMFNLYILLVGEYDTFFIDEKLKTLYLRSARLTLVQGVPSTGSSNFIFTKFILKWCFLFVQRIN